MTKTYRATSVLWTRSWGTKPGANETIAKDLIKSLIAADVNSGKLEYTKQEIMDMLEYSYGRAGSTNPSVKATRTWSTYACPEQQAWFI